MLSKITTVCRHWREAALDCATLWANIAFSTTLPSTVQCAALFLGRSKGAMLSVCVWDSAHPTGGPAATEASKRLLEDISSQSHRILWCELFSSSPDFWKYWSLPAPGLRKLVVEGCCVETPPVFGGVIPQLQTLTSVNNTPWTLGNYAALRKAELHNYHQHPPFATLLDALEGCRMLEKLTLHGYTQMTQDARGPSTILLPCLRQIDFSSCDSALILEHLDTPSLSGPAVIQDTSPRRNILQSLPSTQRSTPYLEGVTELHVVFEANRAQYYVSGYRDDGRSAFSIVTRGVDHRFRWTWVLSSIEAVASSSHFSEIRTLKLVTDGAVVPWKMWLRKLRHIRNLSVSCPKPEDLFTALLTTPEDGLPLCPSLRTLAISRCGRCANVDPSSLLELVLHRHWTGRPLRRLALHQDDWEFIRRLDMDKAWDYLTKLLCAYLSPHIKCFSLTIFQLITETK